MSHEINSEPIRVELSQRQIKQVLKEFHDDLQTNLFDQRTTENKPAKLSPIDALSNLIDDAIDSIQNILNELSTRIVEVIENVKYDEKLTGNEENDETAPGNEENDETSTENEENDNPSYGETIIEEPLNGNVKSVIKYSHKDVDERVIFVWRIENFTRLKRDAELGRNVVMFSEAFFSRGYHTCLLIGPNGVGDAKGRFLSAYFQVMEGPEDGNLKWPCKFNLRFTLLDQINNKNHYFCTLPASKSVIYKPAVKGTTFCRGERYFFPFNKMAEEYLFNDCIILKMDVNFV